MGSAASRFDDLGREKVVCQLCKLYYHRLDVHLSKKHGVTVKQYNEKFPGAPTISETGKLNAAEAQKSDKAEVAPVEAPKPEEGNKPFKLGVLLARDADLSMSQAAPAAARPAARSPAGGSSTRGPRSRRRWPRRVCV